MSKSSMLALWRVDGICASIGLGRGHVTHWHEVLR